MPDIAMCNGGGCPKKETCFRYRAVPNPLWQAWSVFPTEADGDCEYYIEVTNEQVLPKRTTENPS